MKGINGEMVRRGVPLLIQTQDVIGPTSYIETLIYGAGRLVYSRKTPMPTIRQASGWPDRLNKLLSDAHQEVLDDLQAGRLDSYLPVPGR